MEKTENYFSFKKYNIYYRIVSNTSSQPETGVLYLHGKNVHSGYLEKIIDPDSNFIYFSFDNPGQGRSSGTRGGCDIYRLVPQLIRYFIENIIAKFKIRNLYITGESLGALIGFYFVRNFKINAVNIAGIIFIPAIFRIKEMERPGKRLAVFLLNLFCPVLPIKNRTSFTFYTKDEKKLNELNKDPFYSHEISVRFLYGIYRFYRYFKQNLHLLKLPVLFIHGRDDHYSGKTDLAAAFRNIKHTDSKRIIYLKNSNHWLMIGEEMQKIQQALRQWILIHERKESNRR